MRNTLYSILIIGGFLEYALRVVWYKGIVHAFELLATITAFLVWFVLLILAIPVGYVRALGWGDRSDLIWSQVFQTIFRWYLWAAGIHIEVRGAEFFPYGQPAVLALNHPSILDGPIIDTLLSGRPTTALTAPFKYFPWPISFWFKKMGGIEVARSQEEERKYPTAFKGLAAIDEGVRQIHELHKTLFLFPEGHTEQVHHPKPFKTGAVRLAILAQVPLIPVTIKGGERVFNSHHMLRPGTIRVIFHKPMPLPVDLKAVEDKKLIDILTSQLLCRIAQDLEAYYYTPGMALACKEVLALHPVTSQATGLIANSKWQIANRATKPAKRVAKVAATLAAKTVKPIAKKTKKKAPISRSRRTG